MKINYPKLGSESYRHMLSLEASLKLDTILKELVKLRVSQINGCTYCVDMHSKSAKKYGESELRLYHLPVWRESPLFSDREKAALKWAEAMTLMAGNHHIDAVYQETRAFFDEQEMVDLTFVISTINAWNRLGVAFQPVAGSTDKLLGLDNIVS